MGLIDFGEVGAFRETPHSFVEGCHRTVGCAFANFSKRSTYLNTLGPYFDIQQQIEFPPQSLAWPRSARGLTHSLPLFSASRCPPPHLPSPDPLFCSQSNIYARVPPPNCRTRSSSALFLLAAAHGAWGQGSGPSPLQPLNSSGITVTLCFRVVRQNRRRYTCSDARRNLGDHQARAGTARIVPVIECRWPRGRRTRGSRVLGP
eukprot:3025604-Rhodomonas_salina.3